MSANDFFNCVVCFVVWRETKTAEVCLNWPFDSVASSYEKNVNFLWHQLWGWTQAVSNLPVTSWVGLSIQMSDGQDSCPITSLVDSTNWECAIGLQGGCFWCHIILDFLKGLSSLNTVRLEWVLCEHLWCYKVGLLLFYSESTYCTPRFEWDLSLQAGLKIDLLWHHKWACPDFQII